MSISKTELINKSLTLVGANPITNIDDDTNNARIVSRVYESALRSILSECSWNFACKRRLLTLSADTLEWYYTNDSETYLYTIPTDCIRIFGTNDDNAVWRVEGDYIISDTTGLGIRYVYYLDNPTKCSSSFLEALSDKLCSDIAFMILNSKSVAESLLEKYHKVSLPKAMAENAQVGVHQYLKDDAWVNAKDQNGSLDA